MTEREQEREAIVQFLKRIEKDQHKQGFPAIAIQTWALARRIQQGEHNDPHIVQTIHTKK